MKQGLSRHEVFEQLKPYLTKDVAEMDFHYLHSTESFKHPTFTHEELHAQRDKLALARAQVIQTRFTVRSIRQPGLAQQLALHLGTRGRQRD